MIENRDYHSISTDGLSWNWDPLSSVTYNLRTDADDHVVHVDRIGDLQKQVETLEKHVNYLESKLKQIADMTEGMKMLFDD